ncbi:MAG TPA: hypothetical protein VF235_06965 [Actinomycetota bacterium]
MRYCAVVPGPRTFLFTGAVVLLLVAGLAATLGVRSGPPTCPLGAIWDPPSDLCAVPTDPPGEPSTVAIVPVHVDHKWVERGLIVAVGLLGGVLLTTLGLRLLAGEEEDDSVPLADVLSGEHET